jgi:hypothetical protein
MYFEITNSLVNKFAYERRGIQRTAVIPRSQRAY